MVFSFLVPLQRDWLNVLGAAGAVLAAIGVAVAVLRLWRATSATQAASKATMSALRESQDKYSNHVRAQASRCLSVVHLHIQAGEWKLAASRLDDLYEIAIEFGFNDERWRKSAQRIADMSAYFDKLAISEKVALPSTMRTKWQSLRGDVRSCIAQPGGPLATTEEDAP